MKKFRYLIVALLSVVTLACKTDLSDVWDSIDGIASRVSALEALCKQLNTNVQSIQQIIDANTGGDYITGISKVTEDGRDIGYVLSFKNSGNITIYHGKDGDNGANGVDGHAPAISLKRHDDGNYYWTMDGDWLKDESGVMVRANGIDGGNGNISSESGEVVIPKFEIKNGFWMMSVDGGKNWENLGQATGDKGDPGNTGATGEKGDSFFGEVNTENENYVVLTLSNGETITFPTLLAFEALESRVTHLNTNIESLKVLVNTIDGRDYIKSVEPLKAGDKEIGYTITMAKSSPITIYHGVDGKDGSSVEGSAPSISVKKDVDGLYYWTIGAEFLTGENGEKILAQGLKGDNGDNGTNGQDGVTPKLKIENGNWQLSVDGGVTWENLGQATGDKGDPGNTGATGEKGDSFFGEVNTENENYVVLTLSNGETITFPTLLAFEALESRVTHLNTNIESLKVLVNTIDGRDYIKSVEPLKAGDKEIGYTITMAKSSPITIYHGADGKDGSSVEGSAPSISVKKDVDGLYYWTIGAEFLTGENGEKILAQGLKGDNGDNGTNGQDGVTPKLKIENGNWQLSVDGGVTWENLGQATGDKGENGDSQFLGIETTKDGNYVVISLIDGTEVTLPTQKAFQELEALCKVTNTNLNSLQKLVAEGRFIKSVTSIIQDGRTGYKIIVSGHGENSVDEELYLWNGKNGIDGNDGSVPNVGLKQDNDGNYYWTLDGNWITDNNGNKIKANGTDGIKGDQGEKGEPGAVGKDGITPQIKIENGNWMISIDGGTTWQNQGVAIGEKGDKGDPGDSFIKGIREENNYCVFILEDGTELNIPKNNNYDFVMADWMIGYITNDGSLKIGDVKDQYYKGSIKVGEITYNIYSTLRDSYSQTLMPSNYEPDNSITYILLPNSVKKIGSSGFRDLLALERIDLSSGLEEIGDYAFNRCTSLRKITIPLNVVTIGRNVFDGCDNLKEIKFEGVNPPSVGYDPFPTECEFYVPKGCIEQYRSSSYFSNKNLIEYEP